MNLPKFFVPHIPRTAGTTFKNMIKLVYGNKMLMHGGQKKYPDYEQYLVIQGHIRWFVYDHLPRVIWIRNPVDRIASQYYHWLEHPDMNHDVCRLLIEKGIDIREFAKRIPEMTIYIAGSDLNNFAFVGLTEYFDEDIVRFEKQFGLELPRLPKMRVTKNKPEISSDDRLWIEDYYKDGMKLYEEALKGREQNG